MVIQGGLIYPHGDPGGVSYPEVQASGSIVHFFVCSLPQPWSGVAMVPKMNPEH